MIDVEESKDFKIRLCTALADAHGLTFNGKRGSLSVRVTMTPIGAAGANSVEQTFTIDELEDAIRAVRRASEIPRKEKRGA